jgi:hypothetical protein
MLYMVHLAVVFEASVNDASLFDIWEQAIVVDANGPSEAIENAVATYSRTLGGNVSRQALGYEREPVFYGVRSVHTNIAVEEGKAESPRNITLGKTITIDKRQLQTLRSFENILVPYSFIHIETL